MAINFSDLDTFQNQQEKEIERRGVSLRIVIMHWKVMDYPDTRKKE